MNMIGKSGIDWSKAPKDATHYKVKPEGSLACWYKARFYWEDAYDRWDMSSDWSNTSGTFEFIPKKEDLEMSKEVTKQVSGIKDLEVGMFLRHKEPTMCYLVVSLKPFMVCAMSLGCGVYSQSDLDNFKAWSYTYNGEYTPIVQQSETDIKIKELEETITQASQQLQELKELHK